MHPTPAHFEAIQKPPYPQRFSWKMRLFLSAMIFWMTYRCVSSAILPMGAWYNNYAVTELPPPLPSPVKRVELRESAGNDNLYPVWSACLSTADSLWDYLRPWPGADMRKRVTSLGDAAKCTACWVYSRLIFLERLASVNQEWGMYAPGIDDYKTYARAKLIYSDGSEIVVRQLAEPEDYTHFSHILQERIINFELVVLPPWDSRSDENQMWSYCNYLAHHHARNAAGAKLQSIMLYYVIVQLASPGEDAMAHYQEQNRRNSLPPQEWTFFYAIDAEQFLGGK